MYRNKILCFFREGRWCFIGTNYYAVKKKPTINKPLHIGKSSVGWKFLFQEVNKYNSFDSDLEIHTFEQWKEFLENNNEIVKPHPNIKLGWGWFLNLFPRKLLLGKK